MAEARRVRGDKWRIYFGPSLDVVRDAQTGLIAAFDSLEAARRWWDRHHPGDPPLEEGVRCARCGAYFGRLAGHTTYGGRYYHPQHLPEEVGAHRR